MPQTYIAALEIGSSHIRLAVGTVDADGSLTLIAKEDVNVVDSTSYGWIKNIDDISGRVNALIRQVENYNSVSPHKIRGVYVGLGGRSMMANPVKVVRQFDDEVELNSSLIDQMKEEARLSTAAERQVLEVTPRAFVVDNQPTSKPLGVLGRRIEVEFNVISARNYGTINTTRIDTLAQRQELSIKGKFVRQTALAELVLTPEEMDLGCVLVDFGAETTGVSIYRGGSLRYFVTLPIGSRVITRDLMTLNLTEERAGLIKCAIGDAANLMPKTTRNDIECNPADVNGYIYHRAAEIVVNIVEQVKYADMTFSDLPKGIVLVGGGSKLMGFPETLSRATNSPVRLGTIPATVRVSDSKMQSIDMLDVMAILKKAAANPVECTEVPVNLAGRTDGYSDDVPVDTDGPGPQPIKRGGSSRHTSSSSTPEKPAAPKKQSGPGIFTRAMNKLNDFFNEPEEER